MRKGKDPELEPDLDPSGPKTCGSCGSGSPTLLCTFTTVPIPVPDIARSVSAGEMFPVGGYLDAADPVPLVVQGVLLARLQGGVRLLHRAQSYDSYICRVGCSDFGFFHILRYNNPP
jgi:hypothetical protein